MPKPLNAFESVAMGRTAQSAIAPAKDRETPHKSAATPPRGCRLCVPVVRIVEDSYFLTVTETSHDLGCLNHPNQHTHTN